MREADGTGVAGAATPIAPEERLRFLAEASALLASSLDVEEILAHLAQLAVPSLADWCVVYLRDGDRLRQLALAHTDPGKAQWADKLTHRWPPVPGTPNGVWQAIETGEPVLTPVVGEEQLRRVAQDAEHFDTFRNVGLRSFMAVPLKGRGPVLGAISFFFAESGRRYGDDDVELAVDVARRAAIAVEHARLYREAELQRRRLSLQNDVARVLAQVVGRSAASRGLIETICANLGWDAGAIWRIDGDVLRCNEFWIADDLPASAEAVAELAEVARATELRPGEGLPGRVWASGEAQWIEDLGAAPYPPRGERAFRAGLRSSFGFPLRAAGELIGVAEIASREPRAMDDVLISALPSIGSQVGQFLERLRAEDAREALLVAEQSARAEAEAAAEMLRRLEQVTRAALAHLSVGDLLDELLRQIVTLSPADACVLMLVREDGSALVVEAARGIPVDVGHELPVDGSYAGQAFTTGAAVTVADVRDEAMPIQLQDDYGMRSLVAVPIVVEGRPIGVVEALSHEVRLFTENDARLMQLIADRVALAVNQSRLYEAERAARDAGEQARRRLSFLAEASIELAASLNHRAALQAVAELVVAHLADWCAFDLADEDGVLERVAVAVSGAEETAAWVEADRRWPARSDDPIGPPAVFRSGVPELAPELTEETIALAAKDAEHLDALMRAGLSSYVCVPLHGRDRVAGTLTLVAAGDRQYDESDLALAEELGRRAAVAVENALLYRAAEERGRAARVLDAVGDGVFLLDRDGVVRFWNPAAEAITGLAAALVVGRPAREALPGWASVEERAPVSGEPGVASSRAEAVPLDVGGREVWISISGVGFDDGIVYAFRDLTQDRALDELKTDFISTVSHELRTPLAAIYGAAMTLQRRDVTLAEEQRERLLNVVSREAERLAVIVNDILWASRLDSGRVDVAIQNVDVESVVGTVVEAAEVHRPPGIEFRTRIHPGLPPVVGDPDKIRQVLTNLVDNAVKYSPDGGVVELEARREGSRIVLAVHDPGLGVPPAEQRRIFEKFYRLDPNLTRGVGGTGLGLYICRELAHRMNGRLGVISPRANGAGSTFLLELPSAAGRPVEGG